MELKDKEIVKIGEGWVSHARPTMRMANDTNSEKYFSNSFRYPIFNLMIPVHETSKNWQRLFLSVKAKDYLEGEDSSLNRSIRIFLKKHLNYDCDSIWLQTLPRMFGYVFNPVSFWYLYQNEKLDAVLCEVNNTFGDRHYYFVNNLSTENHKGNIATKSFHVSPFFKISGEYHFNFEITPETSNVSIRLSEGSRLQLDTRIKLKFKPLSEFSAFRILMKYGWITAMVIFRIHYQALKIWFKGGKYVPHPSPPANSITRTTSDRVPPTQ